MFYLVLTTVRSRAEAKRIAGRIVGEKLAACANVLPSADSTFWWRGRIERASEALLLAKTSSEKLNRLMARVKELHSYEVPEVIALPIGRGLPEYMKWLKGSLR